MLPYQARRVWIQLQHAGYQEPASPMAPILNGTAELLPEKSQPSGASCPLRKEVWVAPLQSKDNAQTSPLGLMEVRNKAETGSGAPRQPMKSHLSGVFAFPLRPAPLYRLLHL